MQTRKDKLKTARKLLDNDNKKKLNITPAELKYIQKFGFCIDTFFADEKATMFVPAKDEPEAERIVKKLETGTGKDVLMFVIDSNTAPQ